MHSDMTLEKKARSTSCRAPVLIRMLGFAFTCEDFSGVYAKKCQGDFCA